MVAGVCLRFGTGVVTSVQADVWVADPMVVTWVVLSTLRGLVVVLGRFQPAPGDQSYLAQPVLVVPQFSIQAMVELVVPLAITVLVVQNGQGLAMLSRRSWAR
jgi:benzoate membrane transport protein